MKKIYTLMLAMACSAFMFAQDVDVSIELVYTDDGTVEGYPAGFSTWKIYAVLPAADDFLSSVYATFDSAPATITTSTNQIWNSAQGGVSALTINPAIWEVFPAAQYDSYVTIGQEDMTGEGPVTYISISPSVTAFDDSFGVNGNLDEYLAPNLTIVDGAWFNIIGDPDGEAGDDLKVLIAQVTTDGDIEVCMNFQVFLGGENGEMTVYDEYCDMQLSPLSIGEIEKQNIASIAPNPMNEQTVINFNGLDVALIQVRDLSGKIVEVIPANMASVTLDRKEMNSGLYLIQMIDSHGGILECQRLVVR